MKPFVLTRLQLVLTLALPQGDTIVSGRDSAPWCDIWWRVFSGAKLGSKIK